MNTIGWKFDPKGPGLAEHMFCDARGGERVELLAYDCPADDIGPRMCGFEVFVRGRRRGRFYKQVAAGEAATLNDAKLGALKMVARVRDLWSVEPRSWVTD